MINAISEIETGTVEEAPFCLGCGSQRMDWTGTGWKCQKCGQAESIEIPEPQFTPEQVSEANTIMARAVRILGPMPMGQAVDLLLDNLSWLQDSVQARHLLIAAMAAIKVARCPTPK